MAKEFDAYHRWLGIPSEEQPANHYRLLGLALFESDPEVIRDAAERQSAHVRGYALGKHSDLSQSILNELGKARACLLDEQKRSAYDHQLRQQLAVEQEHTVNALHTLVAPATSEDAANSTRASTGADSPAVRPSPATARRRAVSRHRRRPIWNSPIAMAGAAAGVLVCILAVVMWLSSISSRRGNGGLAGDDGDRAEAQQLTKPQNQTRAKPSSVALPSADVIAKRPAANQAAPSPKETPSAPPLAVAPFDAALAKRHQKAWADHLGLDVEIMDSIGMKLVLLPAGEFLMGSPDSEVDRFGSERPQHRVRLTKPFYLGMTEVTQGQWESVMGTQPWSGEMYIKEGADYAAGYVSWEGAASFCKRLSAKEGRTYRLPTEAEWEYACRAGTTTVYSFGDDASKLGDYAWYGENARRVDEQFAHLVGQKRPNAFGLYDMHGNVWEWCSDWYAHDYYSGSPAEDPTGSSGGSDRVYRGGSWSYAARYCRSANRMRFIPSYRSSCLGFRLACSPSGQ